MSSLGEKIRKLRMSRKMTQSDLAKKLDVTTSTISFYENNMRLPSYEVLVKLSRVFEIYNGQFAAGGQKRHMF